MTKQREKFSNVLAEECKQFMLKNNIDLESFSLLMRVNYLPDSEKKDLVVTFMDKIVAMSFIEDFGTKNAVLVVNNEKRIKL